MGFQIRIKETGPVPRWIYICVFSQPFFPLGLVDRDSGGDRKREREREREREKSDR